MDWKEKLSKLANDKLELNLENIPETEPEENIATPQTLTIELDKKGRNGKQATLIFGFEGSDAELKELARLLKQHCSAGGSVRDGEILLQGDCREKASIFLRKQGHKVK